MLRDMLPLRDTAGRQAVFSGRPRREKTISKPLLTCARRASERHDDEAALARLRTYTPEHVGRSSEEKIGGIETEKDAAESPARQQLPDRARFPYHRRRVCSAPRVAPRTDCSRSVHQGDKQTHRASPSRRDSPFAHCVPLARARSLSFPPAP